MMSIVHRMQVYEGFLKCCIIRNILLFVMPDQNIYEPQREKTYYLTCVPSEDSIACASAHSGPEVIKLFSC